MALILNIDTTSNLSSVNISKNGIPICTVETGLVNDHSKVLTLQIKQACKKAGIQLTDIDAIGFSEGPGSYTGLRIGAATSKGLCFALEIPLIAVGTMKSLAWKALQENGTHKYYVTVIPSRQSEVYIAVYDHNLNEIKKPRPLFLNQIRDFTMLLKGNIIYLSTGSKSGFGSGHFIKGTYTQYLSCSAENLCSLSYLKLKNKEYKNVIYFEPLYLKNVYVNTDNNLLSDKR